MKAIIRGIQLLLILSFAGQAAAAQWVATPATIPGTNGIFQAGGGCVAWAKATGDQMLFFDVWSGEWTELTLPETHPVQRIEAAGNLVLVVCDDLAVVFNGPEQTVHPYALTGTFLNTGYTGPSWGCSDELAAVLTDAEFIVFDARLDAWQVLENPLPGDFVSYQSLAVEADFTVADLTRAYPNLAANRAYSLHTGTFLVTDEGLGSINGDRLLDHGYAGIAGIYPNYKAVGYCAFNNEITVGVEVDDGLLAGDTHSRDRGDLNHLWAAIRNVPVDYYDVKFHMWVFDTLTGSWKETSFTYDRTDTSPISSAGIGGQFASCAFRDDDTRAQSILYYSGETRGFTWHDTEIYQTGIGRIFGGSVGAWGGGPSYEPPVWWCRSVEHPAGQHTTSTRDYFCCSAAGDDWISTGQRSNSDPLMDLFFYHGPTNTMTQVETWDSTGLPSPGAHVNTLVTYGADVQVNFYSSVTNTVAQRTLPNGTSASQWVNDYFSLVAHNGVGDYLFDARTGVVHSRGIDYTANSLGANLVIGHDPAGNTAHGYSAMTEAWSTQAVGGPGYGIAGANVACFRLTDGSKYWGYSALDDSWTELVTTGALEAQTAGVQTIIVRSSDRAWAFWPSAFISAVDPESEQASLALAHAVGQVRCYPNPFNGRALVEFALPVAAQVKIQVFDVRGRLVDTLLNERRKPGAVVVPWQTDRAASGTYLVRLTADGQVATKKLVLVQ